MKKINPQDPKSFLLIFLLVISVHVPLILSFDYVSTKLNSLAPGSGSTLLITAVNRGNSHSKKIHTQKAAQKSEKNARTTIPLVENFEKNQINNSELGAVGSGSGDLDPVNLYKLELRQRIEENKFYPLLSKKLNQTGTVEVSFTVLKSGHIMNVNVFHGSGSKTLDDAAVKAVKDVKKFKPLPEDILEKEYKLPIVFSLNKKKGEYESD